MVYEKRTYKSERGRLERRAGSRSLTDVLGRVTASRRRGVSTLTAAKLARARRSGELDGIASTQREMKDEGGRGGGGESEKTSKSIAHR